MTTQTARTPTARELTAARKQATPPTPAPVAEPQVPAVRDREQEDREYRERYLDECAPSGVVGRLLKFKEGRYVTTDDGKEVPEGSEFILLADQTLVGWNKFNGAGEAPTRRMGLLYDGFRMPLRETLGDLDESTWELGLDKSTPQDPWLHMQCLVLQATDAASELYTFSTTTPTGRKAVGNVLRHFNRMQRTHPGQYPVVKLGRGGFEHKDKRVGWVDVPLFIVVGRIPRDWRRSRTRRSAGPTTSTTRFRASSDTAWPSALAGGFFFRGQAKEG